MKIDNRVIGKEYAPFNIAEAGINHNGDVEKAIEMVKVAKECGADAIKFQTFKTEEFVGNAEDTYTYQSQGKEVTETMLTMFKRHEFPIDSWKLIKQECQREGITFISTPQNPTDLSLLMDIGIPAIKIGSDDFTNLPLIREYSKTDLPLILSCGMADLADVHYALYAAGFHDGKQMALLLCTSQYPTPAEDVNILKLNTIQSAFPGLIMGFSDHTQGHLAATLALAMGAVIFEKHFTLDHDLAGPDHWFSEEPDSLAEWISSIKQSHRMMGSPLVEPTEEEIEIRKLARRSIVALTEISKGTQLTTENIGLRRPGTGLAPSHWEMVLGTIASRNIDKGEVLKLGDMVKE